MADAGPHRLDRAQTPGPDDVPGALELPPASPCAASKRSTATRSSAKSFFDGLELGDDAVVGEVNNGWEVASRQLHHERRAVGGGSEFASGTDSDNAEEMPPDHVAYAELTGQGNDPAVQALAGRALVRRIVKNQLIDHVGSAIGNGSLPPNAGTLIRLFHAETTELEVDTALAIAGSAGVVDEGEELSGLLDSIGGVRYLSRQTGSLGGGSSEMARNVISERILASPANSPPIRVCRSIRSSAAAPRPVHTRRCDAPRPATPSRANADQ